MNWDIVLSLFGLFWFAWSIGIMFKGNTFYSFIPLIPALICLGYGLPGLIKLFVA